MPLCSHRLEDPSFSGKYRRYIVIVLQKKRGKYRKVYRDKYGKANTAAVLDFGLCIFRDFDLELGPASPAVHARAT